MESEEEEPKLFEQPAKRDYKLLKQIIVWAIVLTVVAVLGMYCFRSVREQNARDAEKEVEAKEKRDAALNEEKQSIDSAINSYHEFVRNEFPGWTLEGDSLKKAEPSWGFLEDEPIYFYAHLSRNGKSRIVRLAFIFLHKEDGTEYWLIYRPTTIALGNLELNEIKKKEFKTGQENPPEPDYDPGY